MVTVTLPPSTTFNPGATVLPAGWYSSVVNGCVVITTSTPLAPDTPIDLPIVVNVGAGVEPGTSLEFGGLVTSDTPDDKQGNNAANTDTSVIGLADLSLTKDGPPSVVAGDQVTYTVVVSNNGPSTAQSADIKDALPAGVSLAVTAIQRSGGGLAACGGTVCQVGDMAAGEVVTLTVVDVVDSSVVTGTVLTTWPQSSAIRPTRTRTTTGTSTRPRWRR